MRPSIAVLFISTFLFMCSQVKEDVPEQETAEAPVKIKFDRQKWSVKEEGKYTYREQMLDDVVSMQSSIRQLRGREIFRQLGEPDRVDSLYFFYTIDRTQIEFFTLNAKTMVIKLKEDSTIQWIKIHG